MDTQKIPLESIRIDGGTQIRVKINTDVVAEYAELIDKLPPVTVFFDGSHYWLADGFHRYHAAGKAGATMIEADVRKGTVEDARWFAAGANQQHGLRRTNKDKLRAIMEALQMRPELSNRAIAEHVGVDDKTVAAARDQVRCGNSAPARQGRDGKTYPAHVEKQSAKPSQDGSKPASAEPPASKEVADGGRSPKPSAKKATNPLDRHPAIKALLKRLYNLSCLRDEQLSALAVREVANQLKKELARVL